MGVDVLDQLQLRLRRADHQDLLSSRQRGDDLVVINLVLRSAAAAQRSGADMQVRARGVRADNGFFDIVRADVHHMGFGVVDPDDGVVMRQKKLPGQ